MSPGRRSLRLALLGAFAFPAPQGSQRYAAEQARALSAAGARVTLFCYGFGDGRTHPGIDVVRTDAAFSPRSWRAGFDARKVPADHALLAKFLAAHREAPFEAVLAHNAEAALIALAARARGGPAVVYVAHTLWTEELAAHLPRGLGLGSAQAGELLDAGIARAADAVLALSECARAALARNARGPVLRIAPGLAREPTPDPELVAAVCERNGLEPDAFAIYAGNLDAYQDLPDLDAAARALPGLAIVAATHDPRRHRLRSLQLRALSSPEEARLLVYGARVAVVPRRHAGGFPIKLLQYMEARRAIVARAALADTLRHEESGWLVAEDAGPEVLAAGMRHCCEDAALRERLGAGARKVLEHEHDWPPLAEATLRLVEEAVARRQARRSQ